MALAILGRPFQELDTHDDDCPVAQRHFRGSQAFAPTPVRPIWEIGERASSDPELLELRYQDSTEFCRDSGPEGGSETRSRRQPANWTHAELP
jgi:hypothetical protein